MSGVSRKEFGDAFSNAAIDLGNEGLRTELASAGLDARQLDALDSRRDGRVSGQKALDALYDEIDRLDRQTTGLASKQELGLWGALRGAAVAPRPISPRQGEALAASARRMIAEDQRGSGDLSSWSYAGAARCKNPALSSKEYATNDTWKCNVFVGEAFYRAGLPFPINVQGHYAAANDLPSRSSYVRRVAKLDDVRPGDVLSIHRTGDSGHAEIVTGVERDASGHVVSLRSVGAHENGPAEGTFTAAPLVQAAALDGGAASATIDGCAYRILRPMAPPPGATGARR
jgi:hypothetical protein